MILENFLQLFADGEGATADSNAMSPDSNVEQTTEKTEANTEADDRQKAYKQFKTDYKAEYDADVQGIIKDRLKKANAETQKLNDYKTKTDKILESLAVKYNLNVDQIDEIVNKVENDDSYFEDAALDRGMDVDDFRKIKQMELENQRLKSQQEKQEQENRQRAMAEKVNREVAITKARYPSFDIETEFNNNPRFAGLVQRGVDVLSAYEVSHMNDFANKVKEQAAQEVANKMQTSAINNQNRPHENGINSPNAVSSKTDISKLTKEQMNDLKERARRGEKITFNN